MIIIYNSILPRVQSSCHDPQRFRDERGAKSWLSVRSGPQQRPWVERHTIWNRKKAIFFHKYLVRFNSSPARCLSESRRKANIISHTLCLRFIRNSNISENYITCRLILQRLGLALYLNRALWQLFSFGRLFAQRTKLVVVRSHQLP